MLLQAPSDDGSLVNLILACVLSAALLVSYTIWMRRIRKRQIRVLNSILQTQIEISVDELAQILDKKPLDKSSIISIIKSSDRALLTFSTTKVISAPLLRGQLKKLLLENSIIHPSEQSTKWGITEDKISSLLDDIAERDKLDILRTLIGSYIVVPDLKTHLKDTLDLHGRIDLISEAQRVNIDPIELRRLIDSWGWNLLETSKSELLSIKWLTSSFERILSRDGFIDLSKETERLHLTKQDILHASERIGWNPVQTSDNCLIPKELLEKDIIDRIETDGFIDLQGSSEIIKVGSNLILKILRANKYQIIVTKDNHIVTIDYLQERLREDLELIGIIEPMAEADVLGVETSLIEKLLSLEPGVRKGRKGRYMSMISFRRWLLNEFKENGVVKEKEALQTWGLSRTELVLMLKQFAVKTTLTKSGDYLSLSWARQRVYLALESGSRVQPVQLAQDLNVDEGIAEVIMSQVDADAIYDISGSMVPISEIKTIILDALNQKGMLDPVSYGQSHGFDVSDFLRVIEGLELDLLKSKSGKIVSIRKMIEIVKNELSTKGIYDIQEFSRKLKIDYEVLAREVEPHLAEDEIIADTAGVIATTRWIQQMKAYAENQGALRITAFAREKGLRRASVIALARRFLKGAYIPRSDSFLLAGQ
jgi:hypothetical protein